MRSAEEVDPDRESSVQLFLARWLADLDRGETHTLEHYLELFPDRAGAIRAEWEILHREEAPDPSAGTGAVGPGERTIGPYRVLREIGRGGQGVVYLAEDTRLPRRVALKVLNSLSALSSRNLARFLREADVASRLDHPCICAVYERGTTDGVPYIAMRYAEGSSLARLVADARLASAGARHTSVVPLPEPDESSAMPRAPSSTATARIAPERAALLRVLFLVEQIARALHEAHQLGFAHRDVKPSNLIVARDGRPVILDFGLASAQVEGFEQLTHTGEMFGTPAYMSPEQVSGTGDAVGFRTDLYSLGATLYECLTLHRPFESSTRQELYYSITNEEPPAPADWNPAIPSEVVAILGKAMEKEPARRYATALDMAEDLRRFRSDEPILARPASDLYRLQKLARRHRGLVIGLAAAFLMLALAVVGTSLGLWRARQAEIRVTREAVRAKAVRDFLQRMLASADPSERGRDATIVEALEAAEQELETSFGDQPDIRAALYLVIGSTYSNLGLFAEGERNLVRSLQMNESALGPRDPDTLRAVHQLGSLYWDTKRPRLAEPLLRRAVVDGAEVFGAGAEETLGSMGTLALVLYEMGNRDEAGRLLRDTHAIAVEKLGTENFVTLTTMNNLARWYELDGEIERAVDLLEETIALRRRLLGDDHPKTSIAIDGLALVLQRAGRLEEAEKLFREALKSFEVRLGPGHLDTLRCQGMLAFCLHEQGKLGPSEELFREAIAIAEQSLPPYEQDSLELRWHLAQIEAETGRTGEAADTASAALEDALGANQPSHQLIWRLTATLEKALLELEEPETARAWITRIDPIVSEMSTREDVEAARMARDLLPYYRLAGMPERVAELERLVESYALRAR